MVLIDFPLKQSLYIFNRVQVRGIRRLIYNFNTLLLKVISNDICYMNWRIILHKDRISF